MSELYLILRRRLEDVTDWVEIGTEPLKNARKAQGLSYEAMGRRLNVAAKTWERWEKAGRLPRHDLRRIAEMLELDIEWPRRGPPVEVREAADELSLPAVAGAEEIRALRDEIRGLRDLVEADMRDRGREPREILLDDRLQPEEPGPGAEGREVPGEAA